MTHLTNTAAVIQEPDLATLTQFRRDLHRIPEIDFDLPKTLAYIRQELSALPCQVIEPAPSALCAFFDLGSERTTAVRTDMDALPVTERTGLAWASTHTDKMHACGHDGHMSMALGLARHIAHTLATDPDSLPRNILLVFQPAEETTGGAQLIVESGVFETYRVDRIFGFHVWPDLPAGTIASRPGPLLAATSESTFTFHGKAAHIAKASQGADSLDAAARWLIDSYAFMDQQRALEPCTFKCGLLQSGQARNVISSRTYVEGTLRTFSEEMGAKTKAEISRLAHLRATEAGCTVEVDYSEGYPPVVNNPELFALASAHVNIEELPEPLLIAEDFAFYQRHLPGVFMLLGTGTTTPLHADTFTFDESILVSGLEAYKRLIRIP